MQYAGYEAASTKLLLLAVLARCACFLQVPGGHAAA